MNVGDLIGIKREKDVDGYYHDRFDACIVLHVAYGRTWSQTATVLDATGNIQRGILMRYFDVVSDP